MKTLFAAVILAMVPLILGASKAAPKRGFRVSVPPAAAKDELKDLAGKISALEAESIELDAAIANQRRKLIESSNVDHYVDVNLVFAESIMIANLRFEIDSFPIYQISKVNSVTSPTQQVKVYDGPINPGAHVMHLNMKINEAKSSDLSTPLFAEIEQSFPVTLPDAPFRKTFTIRVAKNSDGKIVPTIEELLKDGP